MKSRDGSEAAKRRAGEHAAEAVADGAVVGLGTGTTAAYAVRALGQAVDAGLDVRGVPTSHQSRALALEAGVPLVALDEVDGRIAIAIDGADQVALDGSEQVGSVLLKGGGGAHARERVVAAAADRFLVVVDETKLADEVDAPVPVEVLPDARPLVERRVRALDGEPTLRDAARKDGPVVTDNGNHVLDCKFGTIGEPAALTGELDAVPGVVAHGLFVGLADEIHVGSDDGVAVESP